MKGPALMFCGHTDTVGVTGMRDPFTPRSSATCRLYGRGAQDMKGGVAAMIDAARVVAGKGGPASGRLIVAAVVDEEHSSIGADALVASWRADAGVVTEPTDLAIAIGHKGFAWIEVDVFGKAAHGSRPADGVDAIIRLGRVLDAARSARSRAPVSPAASAHGHGLAACLIRGRRPRELSSYPDRARLTLERRTLPGEAASAPIDEAEKIIRTLTDEDASFRAAARFVFGTARVMQLPADHRLPQLLGDACAAATSKTASTVGASFWTDAAVLGHARDAVRPVWPGRCRAALGGGSINVADVLACRDVLAELAVRFGQTAGVAST